MRARTTTDASTRNVAQTTPRTRTALWKPRKRASPTRRLKAVAREARVDRESARVERAIVEMSPKRPPKRQLRQTKLVSMVPSRQANMRRDPLRRPATAETTRGETTPALIRTRSSSSITIIANNIFCYKKNSCSSLNI